MRYAVIVRKKIEPGPAATWLYMYGGGTHVFVVSAETPKKAQNKIKKLHPEMDILRALPAEIVEQ